MLKLTLPRTSGKAVTHTLHRVHVLSDMPSSWLSGARSGAIDYDCLRAKLCFDNGHERLVFRDCDGLFVRAGGGRVRLPKVWRDKLGGVGVWTVADVPPKQKRRKRSETRKLPDVLSADCVDAVYPWPLGSVMTRRADGEGWTDCILILEDRIRLGGRYNSKRVRYDGRFYITHRGRRVYLAGELAWRAWDTVTHVYGFDSDADAKHNKTLKGY